MSKIQFPLKQIGMKVKKKNIYNDWFWYEKQSEIWNCIFVEFDAMNIIYLQTKYDLHGRLKNIKIAESNFYCA